MSNVAIKGGLRLYKASSHPQPLETCIKVVGDSVRVGRGDAVKLVTESATSISPGPIVACVARAAAGDSIYGVVDSVVPVIEGTGAVNLGITYSPASTAQYLLIRKANHQDIYTISDDGAAALTAGDIGQNANLVVADCDTASGLSNMKIDATSVAAGNATRQLHIVGVVDDATNDPASTGTRWLVTLNNIYGAGGTGTVGV